MNVEDLEKGQCLLVQAKGVKNGKVQLTFAQKIDNPNVRPSSIAGILNASDDRFEANVGKPRYAWMTGESSDIMKSLGIDVSSLTEGEVMELNILNPEIKGQRLNIQITETTDGNEYEVANFETRAKRAGEGGDYILSADGKYIYVRATVVDKPAQHLFLSNTTRSSSPSSEATDDAVASALDS